MAYAGIPYQVFGVRSGAAALMIAWSRSAMARSAPYISVIFASTALSPSALRGRLQLLAARSFIAALSSGVNPFDFFCRALGSFRPFDDLREAVEPLQPRADALECVGHEHAAADTTDLLRRDELRLLEQPHVLPHSGQRHAEGLGELADRRAAGAEPFEDGAAVRVGEGCERAVDGRLILNH